MSFRDKKIIITAGPTWVAIDNVRVISNTASGATGIILSEKLQKLGAKVTLLLGPTESCCINKKIRLLRFRFFDELEELVKKELSTKRYNVMIHTAAVSDYKPSAAIKKKVKSDMKEWRIKLIPTPKIIEEARKIDTSLILVGFKFEPNAGKTKLILEAKELMKRANLDSVVANTTENNRYKAYILDDISILGPLNSKNDMLEKLIEFIGERLCPN